MNRLRLLGSTDARPPRLDAIVLAGGRASRLGGIDKPALVIRGARLVDHAVDGASAAGADQVITMVAGYPLVRIRNSPWRQYTRPPRRCDGLLTESARLQYKLYSVTSPRNDPRVLTPTRRPAVVTQLAFINRLLPLAGRR